MDNRQIRMAGWIRLAAFGFIVFFTWGCSDNAAELSVEFSWEGISGCTDTSPEIQVAGIPEGTVYLHVSMRDLTNGVNHGGGKIRHDGSGTIGKGVLKKYFGPCPSYGSPKYRFVIKALDADDRVIGKGKKMERFQAQTSEGLQ